MVSLPQIIKLLISGDYRALLSWLAAVDVSKLAPKNVELMRVARDIVDLKIQQYEAHQGQARQAAAHGTRDD